MSALTDARSALHEALVPVFDAPVDGLTLTGRVHRSAPPKLAVPCVFLGDSSGARTSTRNGASLYTVTFPVWIVYDGADRAQLDGIEELVGRVHAAGSRVGEVTGHRPAEPPGQRDGNVTSALRATVVDVELTMSALSLCNPPIIAEAANA